MHKLNTNYITGRGGVVVVKKHIFVFTSAAVLLISTKPFFFRHGNMGSCYLSCGNNQHCNRENLSMKFLSAKHFNYL